MYQAYTKPLYSSPSKDYHRFLREQHETILHQQSLKELEDIKQMRLRIEELAVVARKRQLQIHEEEKKINEYRQNIEMRNQKVQ